MPAASMTPELSALLVDSGLAHVDDDELVPLARVTPFEEDFLVAHDPDRPHEIQAETVLGVNNTTRTLARLTPRRPVARTLDLATGSGALALAATRHSGEVVATDLSGRAVDFARMNAAMNEVHLDLRVGDLLSPVADERFDLITANLPFVVSPSADFRFRDGGHGADEVSRRAIADMAERLNDGGVAVVLCNWIVFDGCEPTERPLEWLRDNGCAAIVIQHSTEEPDQYARRWNEFLLTSDPASYPAVVARWTDAYRDWGVSSIASGAVVLRRTSDAGAPFVTRMTTLPEGHGGAQLLRMFANQVRLRRTADLDGEALALVAPHRLDQAMTYDGRWTAAAALMVLHDTAGIVGQVEPVAVHAILRLDGRTRVRNVIDSVVDDTGLDVNEVERATRSTLHHLLTVGCLEFAVPSSP